MKSTDSTNLIETIIASGAASGYLATIPKTQATTGDGTISLTLGSPPECAISVAAGGKRPLMKDVNGVYNLLSAAIQSVQAWGILPFTSEFAAAIGGYPKYAVCVDSSGAYWVSSADSNTTAPGATDASWVSLFNGYATETWATSNFVKQGGTLTGFGDNNVYLGWRTDGSGLGIQIDTSDEGNVAVQGDGKLGKGDWTEQNYTLPSGGNRTVSLTFNAPSAGYVHVVGSANFAAQNTNQSQLSIVVNGTTLSADNVTGSTAMTNHSCVAVSAGSVTVGSYLGTSSTNPPNVGHTLSYLFVPS